MHDTFPSNGDTHQQWNRSEEEHHRTKKRHCRRRKLTGLAKWDGSAKAGFPCAYILHKRKDKYRTRPIVSCKREPNSKYQRVAARAANFVVRELTADNHSFTLWECAHLAKTVKDEMEQNV